MRSRASRVAITLGEWLLSRLVLLRPHAQRLALEFAAHLLARPAIWVLLLCSGIAAGIAGLPLLRAPDYYIGTTLHDTFFIADLGYRFAGGQVPHLDFFCPLGVAFVALMAAGVKSGDTMGEWLRNASWIALVLTLPAILYAARTRLSNGAAFLFVGICVLTLGVPVAIGNSAAFVTYAMCYNRIAYVLILILIVLVFGEASPAAKPARLDAVLAALIAVALVYTKVNYGAFAFLLLFLWGALYGYWAALAFSTILLAGIALSLELFVAPGINMAYVGDLLLAARSSGLARVWNIKIAVTESAGEIGLAALVGPAICLRLRILTARDAVTVVAVLAVAVLLIAQNAQYMGLFLVLGPLLLLLSRWRDPARREELRSYSRDEALWLMCFFVTVLCVSWPYLRTPYDATFVQLAAIDGGPQGRIRVTGIERLRGLVLNADGNAALLRAAASGEAAPFEVFRKIRLAARPPIQRIGQDEYLESVRDGLSILENCPGNSGILTLDFANPFPMLRSSPQVDGIAWFHYKRTFSEHAFPAVNRLFGRVECVMIPKLPIREDGPRILLRIYGDYIAENFKDKYESRLWTLLRK